MALLVLTAKNLGDFCWRLSTELDQKLREAKKTTFAIIEEFTKSYMRENEHPALLPASSPLDVASSPGVDSLFPASSPSGSEMDGAGTLGKGRVPRLSTLLRGKFGRRRSVGLRKLAGARPASNFERCISTAGWSLYERSVSGNKKRKVVAGDTHNSVAGSSNATRVQTRMVKIVATSKTIDEALESAVVELLGMMELGWLEQEKCPNPGDTLKRLARYAPGSCDPVLIAAMKPVTLSPQCFGVSPALGVSPGKEFVDLLVGGAGEEEVQERWRRLGGWLQGALNGLEQIRSKLGCVHYCISARSLLTDVQCSPLILELGGVQAIGEASAAHYGAGSVWAPPSRLKKNPSRDPVHAGADMTAAGLVLIWNAVCPQKNSKKNLRELYDFHAEAEPACVRMMLEALADALEGHSHSSTAIKSNGNGVPLPGPLSRIEASEKAPGGARRRAWAGTLARRFVSVVEGKAGAPCGGANEKKVVIMRLVRLLREDEPISGVIGPNLRPVFAAARLPVQQWAF